MREIAIITITEASNNERSVLRAEGTREKEDTSEICYERAEGRGSEIAQKRISRLALFHARHGDIANRTIKPIVTRYTGESLQSIVQCDPLVRIDTATQD